MRNILSIIVLMLLTSFCVGQNLKGIRIDYLPGLTMEIDGAGEFITYDTVRSLDELHYLMTSNLKYGVMRINGKNIQLRLVSTKLLSQSNRIDVYKGKKYKIIITTKRRIIGDQKFSSSGFMEVVTGDLKRKIRTRSEGVDPRLPS